MKYSAKNIMSYDYLPGVCVSAPIPLDQVAGFSAQINWHIEYVGFTARIEVSNNYAQDLNGNVINSGDWDFLSNSYIAQYDQFTDGSYVWNVEESNYLWARVVVFPDEYDPYSYGKVFAVTKGN